MNDLFQNLKNTLFFSTQNIWMYTRILFPRYFLTSLRVMNLFQTYKFQYFKMQRWNKLNMLRVSEDLFMRHFVIYIHVYSNKITIVSNSLININQTNQSILQGSIFKIWQKYIHINPLKILLQFQIFSLLFKLWSWGKRKKNKLH